jgi:hypothetical protein
VNFPHNRTSRRVLPKRLRVDERHALGLATRNPFPQLLHVPPFAESAKDGAPDPLWQERAPTRAFGPCLSWPTSAAQNVRLIFSFYSPIVVPMRTLPFPKSCVVCCKKCGHDVLTGTDSFPACPVYVVCSLCGEKRKYQPSEVMHGRPHFLLQKRASRRHAPLLISARARA